MESLTDGRSMAEDFGGGGRDESVSPSEVWGSRQQKLVSEERRCAGKPLSTAECSGSDR